MKHILSLLALASLTIGGLSAQVTTGLPEPKVNTLIINSTGDVTLRQGDHFDIDIDEDNPNFASEWHLNDTMLTIDGTSDFFITFNELNYLRANGTGDIIVDGMLKGSNIAIHNNGSGDYELNLDYDHVFIESNATGDMELHGRCDALMMDYCGTGDIDATQLNHDLSLANVTGSGDVNVGKTPKYIAYHSDTKDHGLQYRDQGWGVICAQGDPIRFEQVDGLWTAGLCAPESQELMDLLQQAAPFFAMEQSRVLSAFPDFRKARESAIIVGTSDDDEVDRTPSKKKTLLFDGHWNGFETGLNMLLGPGSTANFEGEYAFLEQRPMRSWVINYNIADVGIAFGYRHVFGLYTGIGLSWNNYSFNHPVRLSKGEDHIEGTLIDENVEGIVKKSKLGVFYVQAPLMLEVRPTRNFFMAAGVTGGIRANAWTKVKFENGNKEKDHSDYYLNLLKLDASFRAGSDDVGFFANFNLLPLFYESSGPTAHTLSFGFSMLF